MNVIQRPQAATFASMMNDYIIDTDSSITFSVKYNNKVILSEDYVPDVDFQVKIRKLGKICAMALWGIYPSSDTTIQSNAGGIFTFLINDTEDTSSYVIFSRLATNTVPGGLLTRIKTKVTREDMPEYISSYGYDVNVIVNGVTKNLYTGGELVTHNVSVSKIKSLFPGIEFSEYTVSCFNDTVLFRIDQTKYMEQYFFRYKNVYDMTEILSCVGGMKLKGNMTEDTAYMYGIKRKFDIKPDDEYTANSGVIFCQSDYKLWHDMLNTQEVEILSDGVWYPIIITKQNYERSFRKSILKAVEFSFKMADPEQNGLIDI